MNPASLANSAQRDVIAAAGWIARDNPAAADAFLDAIDRAGKLIGDHPGIGTVHRELARAEYRFLGLTGFPYIVVYTTRRGLPVIARVIHTARDLPRLLRDLQ
ncbi:MAG: type II toxin-antitoxin system RelE/ParE family toxin [Stellaceae bacterium]